MADTGNKMTSSVQSTDTSGKASVSTGASAEPKENTMEAPRVLKTGPVHKLSGTRRLYVSKSFLSWHKKILTVFSDGTVTYRHAPSEDTSSSSSDDEGQQSPMQTLLSNTAITPSPVLLLRLCQSEPGGFADPGIFVLHTRTVPPRPLYFAVENETEAAEWRAAALTAARPTQRGDLCRSDVMTAAKSLNYRVKRDTIDEVRVGKSDDDVSVFRELRVPKAIRELFAKLSKDGKELSAGVVGNILGVSEQVAAQRIRSSERGVADAAGLHELLCAPENAAVSEQRRTIGDMTRPMSEYYMCSSHNTYLTGDQVLSSSSPLMYRITLEAGVRCVELDLWDSDKGPMITHGNTATSDIPLQAALETIAKYAFVASEYPVVLSLENHLSIENQVLAAKMFREYFGESLHTISLKPEDKLPSPADLKGKILIKAKMGQWGQNIMEEDEFDSDDAGEGFAVSSAPPTEKPKSGNSWSLFSRFSRLRLGRKSSSKSEESSTDTTSPKSDMSSPSSEAVQRVSVGPGSSSNVTKMASKGSKTSAKKKHHIPIARELADVTSLGGASRKILMELWGNGKVHPEGQKASDIVSINESKVEDTYEKGTHKTLQMYNRRNLTRVYPKGSRVDSSNYNPIPAWGTGCQIVAMNYQSADVGFWLNHGRFLLNRRCGYVLKPSSLRELEKEGTVCHFEQTGDFKGAGTLNITVLSGSLLPRSPKAMRGNSGFSDPYVEITLARGVSDDEGVQMQHLCTSVVKGNGLCPSWNEQLSFSVSDAELDLVLVCVWDEDFASKDDLIGFFCAPVHALRKGLRALHLNSADGAALHVPGTSELPAVVCELDWRSMF